MSFFSSDRAVKYGWGVPRLALLTLAAFQLAPSLSAHASHAAPSLGLAPYLASRRWLTHAYLGSIGAAVNVKVHSFAVNLTLLLVAAAACIADARHDYAILVYLAKTFAGDFLAGKLDTREWRLVLLFVFGLFGPALWLLERDASSAYAPYSRVLPALFLIQAVCELGDNYLERFVFFRHRYAFEAASAALLLLTSPRPAEIAVIQHDLVVCLFYRISNFVIILERSGVIWVALRKACFWLFGALHGTPLVNVADVDTAMAVLRASDVKGAALERYVASPAWLPLLSLESVDGPLYRAMLADLHVVVAALPPPAALQPISARLCDALVAGGGVIDAEAIAQLSVQAVVEYLFDAPWHEDMRVIVDASWEWRKEIAVRGKADAAVKAAAIARVIALLRATPKLWALFGEKWTTPRYYSLILQPFLISPCINAGDIAVTLASQPTLSLEDAIRAAHPFPIFERFVRSDIKAPDGSGRVAVKGGTQVIIFTSDLRGAGAWPAFGAGPRACAGTNLALALLRPVHATLRPAATFAPARNHRFSGRNNDGNVSLSEMWYFLKVVAPVVLFARDSGDPEGGDMAPAKQD
jgi:hypothetical protein